MGGAAIGAMVGLQVAGRVMETQSQQATAEYNMKLAKEQGKTIELQGRMQARALTRQAGEQIAQDKVNMLKSGVTLEGSPSDAIALSTESLVRDRLALERGVELQQMERIEAAKADQRRADAAVRALPFQVGTDILTGAAMAG